jgi:hypothetical protein
MRIISRQYRARRLNASCPLSGDRRVAALVKNATV